MTADRMLRWVLVATLLATIGGCGRKPEPAFTTWAKEPESYTPTDASNNAFDAYVLAARKAEATGGNALTRVSFFPGQKAAAIASVKDSYAAVVSATSLPCRFVFVPTKPFTKPPNHQGWRLLGHVFVWKIEDAIKADDYDSAIRTAVAGSRFGFDLTGGGAMDASLGYAIVNDIRQTLVPALPKMSTAQLLTLSEGMRGALARQAPIDTTIQNEHENILLGVQAVQDAFSSNKLDGLQSELGTTVKEAVEYLHGLQNEDLEARQGYFTGFANEADATVNAYLAAAKLPVAKRAKPVEVKLQETRPWRRFVPHFVGTLQPLVEMHDATTARTRLLIITTSLMSQRDRDQLPALSTFPGDLANDPYSGHAFVFRSDGPEFDIYSVGPNGKDDGGDTDSTFTGPDLTLEESM